AALAQDMRPTWQQKAATRRRSNPAVAADRPAGRRKVLILGSASVKITRDSFPGSRAMVVRYHHSSEQSGCREGVSFFAHKNTDTNVERNFKTFASGSEMYPKQPPPCPFAPTRTPCGTTPKRRG